MPASSTCSTNGTLVYGHATASILGSHTELDRSAGKGRTDSGAAAPLCRSRGISHDGTRVVATTVRDPEDNIWVWDLTRRILTRVTTDAALDIQPAWSPDDRWIVFSSNREGGKQSLWRQASDGTGTPSA